ncbi:hypothetical protein CJ030_MR4G020980 [Morella rubra]|uniref:Uncharacterized protein n=1 Tax=Morella rubra TaxID=262757 RepID=A0A6A1VWM5_9ROSI|nr:hypothetical protein CJ030_MR4G020980 [Morella rubra]
MPPLRALTDNTSTSSTKMLDVGCCNVAHEQGEHNSMEAGDAEARTMAESNGGNDTAIEIGDGKEIASNLIQGKLCQKAPTPYSNGSNETSIDIRDESMVSSMQRKLRKKSPTSSQCSIFRVHKRLRMPNEKVFTPHLVSIGPFHHGTDELQPMEEIKQWYLHGLLNRRPTKETSLECFVEVIGSVEQACRECYSEKFSYCREKFIEMMVVDGCFTIEFFRKVKEAVLREKEDPVFTTSWMVWEIVSDLLLLENQLPWRVLDLLFNLTKTNDDEAGDSLLNLVAFSFNLYALPMTRDFPDLRDTPYSHRHLLDFLRNYLLSFRDIERVPDQKREPIPSVTERVPYEKWDPIPSVTELLQAGVRFQTGDANNLLDVTFKDGVMVIPPVTIRENTESLFRNLIAFEQFDPSTSYEFTSFAVLLDNLINTNSDIVFLRQRGILHIFSRTEDTEHLVNRLCKDKWFFVSSYFKLHKDVNAYYNRRRHRWQAILKRDYFNNPWTSMSVVAASLILGLTLLQTMYSVLSYYVRR